jgi:flagellar basal-body rod modification protein FlgD
MTIASIGAATDKIASGKTGLASNMETFLSLLTAQLKNQDPLSPMDSTQFTAQLTQMSGVEQQLLTNDLLKTLVGQSQGGMTAGVDFIGKTVTAVGSTTKLADGAAKWSYELAKEASTVDLEVVDSTGKTVWKGPAPDRTTGVHDFTWDGKSSTGATMPDGAYSLKVTAKAGQNSIDSQVLIRGRATGVEMYDGAAYLTIGGAIVPLTDVITVQETLAS